MKTKIHVEVFVAAQLLGRSQGTFMAEDLRREIEQRFGDTRPGVNTHVSAHCVANAPKNAATVYNYLWRLEQGRLRAFDPTTDQPHPTRANAAHVPRWGDVAAVAGCGFAPDGVVDFTDISCVVDKFKNLPGAPRKARSDAAPDTPDWIVDFTDIPAVVDAFRGLPYPHDAPCP